MNWLKQNWKKLLMVVLGIATLGVAFVLLRRRPDKHEVAAAHAEGEAKVYEEVAKAAEAGAVVAKEAAAVAESAAAVHTANADLAAKERQNQKAADVASVQQASGSMAKLAGLVNRGDQ